jgi:hypothetical protein
MLGIDQRSSSAKGEPAGGFVMSNGRISYSKA